MKTTRRDRAVAFAGAALVGLLAGCFASIGDEGVGVGVGPSYGVGLYEPYGYEYGGWPGGYHVGPPRRGHDRDRGGFRHHGEPAYRPAPHSRPVPSIPSHRRSH